MSTPAPYPVPPEAVLEVCLCHNARRAARALSRTYDAAFAPLGLTAGQFALLAAIGAHEPIGLAGLGEILLTEASTLSRTLRPLRAAGHVAWFGAAGRRAGQLALSAEGARLLAEAVTAWRAVQTAVSGRLGGSAAGALLQTLDKAAKAAG